MKKRREKTDAAGIIACESQDIISVDDHSGSEGRNFFRILVRPERKLI